MANTELKDLNQGLHKAEAMPAWLNLHQAQAYGRAQALDLQNIIHHMPSVQAEELEKEVGEVKLQLTEVNQRLDEAEAASCKVDDGSAMPMKHRVDLPTRIVTSGMI